MFPIRSIIGLYTPVIRPLFIRRLSSKQNSLTYVNEILRRDEFSLPKDSLPGYTNFIHCNQLGSNVPIEDRIRISSLQLPGQREPTILLGVFDGHGGGTTVDLVCRRLFNYISLTLHPESIELIDLHYSPSPKHDPTLRPNELENLSAFKDEIYNNGERTRNNDRFIENLKASFKRCDDDLSSEIQRELTSSQASHAALHYYLSAAVSGCCCIVMILNEDKSYVTSVGDCRAVLGSYNKVNSTTVSQEDLLDEHNCYNREENRRLASSHPPSEQNTIVRHNRLLGHLMPFRAFGDFNYKWPTNVIHDCGITRAYGNSVIPAYYETPPYLIAEPDIKEIDMNKLRSKIRKNDDGKNCIVLATDGLWELFESSRDVIETIATHSKKLTQIEDNQADNETERHSDEDEDEAQGQSTRGTRSSFDLNCATHVIRSALSFGSLPSDCTAEEEELERVKLARLEAMLSLQKSIARNFRDDISTIVIGLK